MSSGKLSALEEMRNRGAEGPVKPIFRARGRLVAPVSPGRALRRASRAPWHDGLDSEDLQPGVDNCAVKPLLLVDGVSEPQPGSSRLRGRQPALRALDDPLPWIATAPAPDLRPLAPSLANGAGNETVL